MEVTEAGLREGVFFEELLAGSRPAAAGRRARGLRAQPRRAVPPRGGAHRARRAARAGDLGRAGRGRRCTRAARDERELLWAAGDAARRRHGGRLRRPPQALALPDPQRRPAGLLTARDGADRPGRALPPQGPAGAARVRAARAARATRSCSPAAPPCCASPSSSSARATRPSATPRVAVAGRHGRAAAAEPRPTSTVSRWGAQRQADVFRARSAGAVVAPEAAAGAGRERRPGDARGLQRAPHGANCITWWMPLGRFVYCMSRSGSGAKAIFDRRRASTAAGSVVPWRAGLGRRAPRSIAAHSAAAQRAASPVAAVARRCSGPRTRPPASAPQVLAHVLVPAAVHAAGRALEARLARLERLAQRGAEPAAQRRAGQLVPDRGHRRLARRVDRAVAVRVDPARAARRSTR